MLNPSQKRTYIFWSNKFSKINNTFNFIHEKMQLYVYFMNPSQYRAGRWFCEEKTIAETELWSCTLYIALFINDRAPPPPVVHSDVHHGPEWVRPEVVRGRDRQQDAREPGPLQSDAHHALLHQHLLHPLLQQTGITRGRLFSQMLTTSFFINTSKKQILYLRTGSSARCSPRPS